ncbi:MAG: beta-ketoacyl-ACP synthase II [Nitriliruptorales bacterium]|nr:beta-ketoacyl-ACP synthase II [Nitriliruptorales bacterium]
MSTHTAAAKNDRVVVTGVGAVTPYGVGATTFFDGLLSGESTARRITRFDPSDYAVQIACEVRDFDPYEHLPRKLVRQVDPFAQYALTAAREALAHAGLIADEPQEVYAKAVSLRPVDGLDPTRIGTLIASGIGGLQEMTDQYERLLSGGPSKVRPYLAIALPLNMGGGQVAIRHGLQGPSFSVVSACASGGDAIGMALDLLRNDRADVILAGGAEAAVNPLTIAGFGAAGALSRRNDEPERASRPFDVDRDGFVSGEGAGVVVLERAEHADARGARVLGELAGYGLTNDAYHPTQPSPDGTGASRALHLALADAGVDADEVDHINAHGTSTPPNDAAEARAIRAVFGSHTDEIAVTSTKSAIGHLLGAAGGVEAVATILAINQGLVPPSLNLDNQDSACDLDVVSRDPRKVSIRAACSNSFGFGGHNAVLVFRPA